jgi:hypothetical protein
MKKSWSSKAPSYCDILSYIGKLEGDQKELIKKLVNFRMISGTVKGEFVPFFMTLFIA